MTYERFGDYERQTLSPDARFCEGYVIEAGEYMHAMREMAVGSQKAGATEAELPTDVTTIDIRNDRKYRWEARKHLGPDAAIHSEEGESVRPGDHEVAGVVDPLDGTTELISTHRNTITGELLRIPKGMEVPDHIVPIQDNERTSCVAAGVFRNGVLSALAIYAPYKDELYVGDRGAAWLNGRRLDLSRTAAAHPGFEPGITYDYASWRGSLKDPRYLRQILHRPPNNTESANMQGCDVATGRSRLGVFTGRSRHDLLGGALAAWAGATFTDLNGNQINWDDPYGGVYSANTTLHEGAIAAINQPGIDGLPPGYRPVRKGEVGAEEVLGLRRRSSFGTEQRLEVWQDAVETAYAFAGAREIATGRLVLASFLTGNSRHGTMHDLVVDPEHRRLGLGDWSINERVRQAQAYRAGSSVVGMAYVNVNLHIDAFDQRVPLEGCFTAHGFKMSKGELVRDYLHG